MDIARIESGANHRARAPTFHPKRSRFHSAPQYKAPIKRIAKRTAFNIAVLALVPWSRHNAPTQTELLTAALLGRAKPHSIRDWRRGTRRPPQWAIDLLLEALHERRKALDHAIELLSKEKGR